MVCIVKLHGKMPFHYRHFATSLLAWLVSPCTGNADRDEPLLSAKTVRENVALPLKVAGLPRDAIGGRSS
jgi:hypothetical protein